MSPDCDSRVKRIQSIKSMARLTICVPYGVTMIALIVGVDVLIFRNHFWERLMVNIGIVLVFAAFYWRFFK